jgi:hypothetical protein
MTEPLVVCNGKRVFLNLRDFVGPNSYRWSFEFNYEMFALIGVVLWRRQTSAIWWPPIEQSRQMRPVTATRRADLCAIGRRCSRAAPGRTTR